MAQAEFVKAIVKEVGKAPCVENIKNDLATLQGLVGGHIEVVSMGDGVALVLNEEGKLTGLPVNFGLGHDVIVGNVVFVAYGNDGDFMDLEDWQIDNIMSSFYTGSEDI